MFETSQTHGLESSAHGGERCHQQAGDATEGATLMTQHNGLLQLLWVERPPLGAAPAASIHQGGNTTGAVLCKALGAVRRLITD
jgi:hypothetical protein